MYICIHTLYTHLHKYACICVVHIHAYAIHVYIFICVYLFFIQTHIFWDTVKAIPFLCSGCLIHLPIGREQSDMIFPGLFQICPCGTQCSSCSRVNDMNRGTKCFPSVTNQREVTAIKLPFWAVFFPVECLCHFEISFTLWIYLLFWTFKKDSTFPIAFCIRINFSHGHMTYIIWPPSISSVSVLSPVTSPLCSFFPSM